MLEAIILRTLSEDQHYVVLVYEGDDDPHCEMTSVAVKAAIAPAPEGGKSSCVDWGCHQWWQPGSYSPKKAAEDAGLSKASVEAAVEEAAVTFLRLRPPPG